MLVRRYQRPIYNAAYRVLGREEDASDVTQTVFLKVAENLRGFDPRFRFFSWIYRIAMNESLNLLRRNGRDQPLGEDEPEGPESVGPEWRAAEAEASARIQRVLMGMKPADRAVITLRHFSDCATRDRAGARDRREDGEVAPVRGPQPHARPARGPAAGRGHRRQMTRSRPDLLMHAVLDGEASAEEARELERVLGSDPAARARFEELQRLFDRLARVPEKAPPPGTVEAIIHKAANISARVHK